MKTTSVLAGLLLAAGACSQIACSVTSTENNTTAGSGGTGGSSAQAGTGGSAGKASAGAGGSSAGAAGESGSAGASAGAAGSGGTTAGTGGATAGSGGASAGSGGAAAGTGGAAAGSGGATAGSGGAAAGSGGAAAGAAGAGGGTPAAAPFFCPETSPFSTHKLPNSVDVQGKVLEGDTTWTADKVYLVFKDYFIDGGHTLTIEPGTTVCLIQDGKIILDGGTLLAKGTPEKHITFTTIESTQEPGRPDASHKGILLGAYKDTAIANVDIWWGGKGGGGGSWVLDIPATSAGTDPTKPLKIDNLTIGQIQTQGISVRAPHGIDPTSTIHITGYAAQGKDDPADTHVIEVDIEAASSVQKAVTLDWATIPEAARHVQLFSVPIIGNSVSLPDYGAPYLFPGVKYTIQDPDKTPTLTLEAGVTLKTNAQFVIGAQNSENDGNLVLAGTAAKPVTMTSLEATPASGDWPGVYFQGGNFDPLVSRFDNAKILYAGVPADLSAPSTLGRCGDNFNGAILIDGQGSYVGPSFKNTLIAHSQADGIVSSADDKDSRKMTTDYAAETTLTFEDIAGVNLRTGSCAK